MSELDITLGIENPETQARIKKIQRSAYIWNTAGSTINAFQSVIILMVLTRVCGLAVAGIFTIAYANACLFLNLGKFGVRNFQASDIFPTFNFRAYVNARALTCIAMLVAAGVFLAVSAINIGYPADKTLAIALMVVFKLVDAVEDVIYGNYQQHGRLDIAGKFMFARIASTTVLFCCCIASGFSLIVTLAISIAYTVAFLVIGVLLVRSRCGLPIPDNGSLTEQARKSTFLPPKKALSSSVKRLLLDCLPLFIATFLLFLIGNIPKYAIDAVLTDTAQAQYGFIAMPEFVVGMLATFIYMPMVTPLSESWGKGDSSYMSKQFVRLIGIIALLTLACDLAAWFLGIPVLNLLYATTLDEFRFELVTLVTGGGFLALANLFNMGITIMRKQIQLVWGYSAVSLVAALVSVWVVSSFQITGAATLYFCCMVVLAAWFGIVFFWYVRCGDNKNQA